MSRRLCRIGLVLTAVALNGCALLAPQKQTPDEAAWSERQQRYAPLNQWSVRARMATGVLGWSGSLSWRQRDEALQLSVSGPLGIGGFQATGSLQHVEVVTADQQRLHGDPEVLYRDVVGWPFPLRHMRYWARGLPVPELAMLHSVDGQGRLISLEQAGWRVSYGEYRQYEGWEMPRRMKLENDELTIRIVIDDWQSLASL